METTPRPDPTDSPRYLRVLVVEDNTYNITGLKTALEQSKHILVGVAATAVQAVHMFHTYAPDMVLLDVRLDGSGGVDGLDLAKELFSRRRCPIIVITAYRDQELIDRVSRAGIYGYLNKPIEKESLDAQMQIAIRRFEEAESLIRQNVELLQTLEDRKIVERAKGIFMKRLSLDEAEAHRRLQLESQKKRLSLPELARRVIENEEMLGGNP